MLEHRHPATEGISPIACGPIALYPATDVGCIKLVLVIQHQVNPQGIVGLLGVARIYRYAEHRLHPAHQVWHQQVVLQLDVGQHCGVQYRRHAVKAVAPVHARGSQIQTGICWQIPRGRQHVWHRVWLWLLVERAHLCGQSLGFLLHDIQIAAIVSKAGIERTSQPKEDHQCQCVSE
ncbi:hypothetical protein D9M72_247260 [compost metagenome]